jgi:hypothetical protein
MKSMEMADNSHVALGQVLFAASNHQHAIFLNV